MKLLILFLCCASYSLGSIIDVFEATNGHEPRVAINCGHVPFHIDLRTGGWVEDSTGKQTCDHDKEEVKRYCQKIYPTLNITNIVEANKKENFKNWCEPGQTQCTTSAKVTPYRCLVDEYEADALMVPDGCNFDHIHDQNKCLTHDQWKKEASRHCKKKYKMGLKDYGILLSCATDMFTGVEFVCCPKKHSKGHHGHKHHKHHKKHHHKDAFKAAIKNFKKNLPVETKGCDRSTYLTKQTEMEKRHQGEIAAVVDEWDEAEKRYNKLKKDHPEAAEKKMQRTLVVFRQTLSDIEKQSKEEKARLRVEHAECINTQISKNKRDAMLTYLESIQKKPVDAEEILKAVRKFIQVCEHDRVHSLRHFEHVRNRDAKKAEALRVELLQHLKDLNKVVNESMSLLNYLPEIAKKFGLTGQTVLKPIMNVPEEKVHSHKRVEEILKKNKHVFDEDEDEDDEEDEVDDAEDIDNKIFPALEAAVEEDKEEAKIVKLIKDYGKTERNDVTIEVEQAKKKGSHHSMVINIILGLCCGILVVMLVVVVVMVVQRRRVSQPRVVLAECNDDREHLVQMQKDGFENPTYKFFYY